MQTTDDLFQFPLGTLVSWGARHTRYLIVQRRYTERDLLGPVVEYLLGSCRHPEIPLQWVNASDLVSLVED